MTIRRFIREHSEVAVIAGAAMAIRIAWVLLVPIVNSRDHFLFDESTYECMATNIAAGNGAIGLHGTPELLLPPGYPAILGSLYVLSRSAHSVAYALNIAATALTCVAVWWLGTRVFGRSAGNVAATLYAIAPGNIVGIGATLSEFVYSAMLAVILVIFMQIRSHARIRQLVTLGAVIGASSLIKGLGLVYGAAILATWLVECSSREALRRLTITVAAAAAIIAPWTVRNYLLTGYPILISTDSSMVFYISHNPRAGGSQTYNDALYRIQREKELPDSMSLPQKEAVIYRTEMKEATAYLVRHPLENLSLAPSRLAKLFESDHAGFHDGIPGSPAFISGDHADAIRSIANIYFHGMLSLCLLGVITSWPNRNARPFRLILLFMIVGHGLLFFGDPRFHIPVFPWIVLFAGAGIAACVNVPARARVALGDVP